MRKLACPLLMGRAMSSRLALLVAVPSLLAVACTINNPGSDGSTTAICIPKTATKTVPGAPGPAITEVTSFGDNPAGLQMFVHLPPGGTATSVVVAMHGCTQNASAYVAAGWNDIADANGFAVVYPQQTSANNIQTCFRWYDSANITRDQGEAKSIASMTQYALSTYGASKAFVTGLSAGAAMTAVMLATYPDLFEAGAIMSGLPYACATSELDAFTCMSPGKDKAPSDWGALVPKVAGAGAPRVSIWQGAADTTVNPSNKDALVRQWTNVNGIAATPASTETVGKATHDSFADGSGKVLVDSWLVTGMPHGVSIDPSNGCGTAGAYVLDEGLCSTAQAASFFGIATTASTPGGATSSSSSSSGGAGASSGGGATSSSSGTISGIPYCE